jgi:hypothetical protein
VVLALRTLDVDAYVEPCPCRVPLGRAGCCRLPRSPAQLAAGSSPSDASSTRSSRAARALPACRPGGLGRRAARPGARGADDRRQRAHGRAPGREEEGGAATTTAAPALTEAPVSRPALSADEARALTDKAKAQGAAFYESGVAFFETLLRLYEGRAHEALGYSSWQAYWSAEMPTSWRHGYRILDYARVVSDPHAVSLTAVSGLACAWVAQEGCGVGCPPRAWRTLGSGRRRSGVLLASCLYARVGVLGTRAPSRGTTHPRRYVPC